MKYKEIIGLFILTCLFLIPLFKPGLYLSHDGDAHVARFAAYAQAFADGQFPPRWAGDLNFGYGTPIFIFYYPLPGYLASFLHLSPLSFESIYELLMAVSFIGGALSFYLWAGTLFKKHIACIGAALYSFAPYHFLDVYVRGDIAEVMAFAFLPLVFLFIERFLKNHKTKYLLTGGISYALLVLSHNGVSLMFSPVLFLYVLFRAKTKKEFFITQVIFITGLALAAFFWIPALYEGRYTNAKLFIGDMFLDHFPTALQLVVSPWGFGPDVQAIGGLSPQIGIVYLLCVLGSVIVFLRERAQRKILGFWLLMFSIAVFITLPISAFVWERIGLLRLYEFPWRFTGLSSFAATLLACYLLAQVKNKKLVFLFFILFLLSSIPFIATRESVSHPDSFYQAFTGTTYYHGEASPIWSAGDPDRRAKAQLEIISGTGEITNEEKKFQKHSFVISAKTPVTILDNTSYFPGWKVFVDGASVPIEFQDPNNRGLITFSVPQGRHDVVVFLGESSIRLFADGISFIAFNCILILSVLYFLHERKTKGKKK